tara:strand:+ start:34 stop:363 length:330 start_codon:yes stop_codon:yes gene_type:complete
MTDILEHKGMQIEFTPIAGEAMTRNYPGADPYVEIESVDVSDWDEFAEWWGAKGESPTFAPSIEELLEKVSNQEYDAISDAAWEIVRDYDDEPDWDEGEEPIDYDVGPW